MSFKAAARMLLAVLIASASADAGAFPNQGAFVFLGTRANDTNPATWQSNSIDVASYVPGATTAALTFDLVNDVEGYSTVPNTLTVARLFLAAEGGQYFMNFEWADGASSSHLRDVRLSIDGTTYIDQYGAFNNHLGDPVFGTAHQGADDGVNILGQTGFVARTYVLSAVPEPAALGYLLAGGPLLLWSLRGRLSGRQARP